jgi:hypothetical protein
MPDAGVDRHLASTRRRIGRRVQASELQGEADRGSVIVDIRPVAQRKRDGELPGAVVLERNVLEWRLDPTSPDRLPQTGDSRRGAGRAPSKGHAARP